VRSLLLPFGGSLVQTSFTGYIVISHGCNVIHERYIVILHGYIAIQVDYIVIHEGCNVIPEQCIGIPRGGNVVLRANSVISCLAAHGVVQLACAIGGLLPNPSKYTVVLPATTFMCSPSAS